MIVGSGRSATSSYKRSPRHGFMARMYSRLRHLLKRLMHFLKTNPVKVIMLVIMPLITGGALGGLLSRFGIRLPASLAGLAKLAGGGGGYSSFERTRVSGPLQSFGGIGGVVEGLGGMGGLGSVMSVAKMFI